MQVLGQFCELSPRTVFLLDLLLLKFLGIVFVKHFSYLLVFCLDMVKVLLTCVKVMLILPAVVATVTISTCYKK